MDNMIEELYDAMYSPKISPEQLINNAILPNYISVHIESNEIGMIVESVCELYDGKRATYIYQFDNYKKLLSLKEYVGNTVTELYNRKREINEKYRKIKNILKVSTSVS